MLPGPVFTFELMTTARRATLYATRALYAIVLLLILWGIHSTWTGAYEGTIPIRMLRWFALSCLGALAFGQELLVLLLTPTLVAGVIADEKRRKTMHYLLASRLTGPEIVLGKLLARMLYMGVLLGVSLPVMSMMVFFGGLDPLLVLMVGAGLFSTAWFLGALSIWVSTIARRPREALFVTFGLESLWLIVPPFVQPHFATGWLSSDTLSWLMEWVGASSPVYAARSIIYSVIPGSSLGELGAVARLDDRLAGGHGLRAGDACRDPVAADLQEAGGDDHAAARAARDAGAATAEGASPARRSSHALERAAHRRCQGIRPLRRLDAHAHPRRPAPVSRRLVRPGVLRRDVGARLPGRQSAGLRRQSPGIPALPRAHHPGHLRVLGGGGRRRGRVVDHVGARGGHLGQPDGDRPDRPRDRAGQAPGIALAGAPAWP